MLTLMGIADDMFSWPCTHLINPVNTKGVMGAGLAKIIKEKFPEACAEYHRRCWQMDYRIGDLIEEYTVVQGLEILHFPTKIEWKRVSELGFIESGFEAMIRKYKDAPHLIFNMPALGCGLGGLDFPDIQYLADEYFVSAHFQVNLFPPKG